MGRFKVRVGETEIEYEGEDSAARYQSALELVKTLGSGVQLKTKSKSVKASAVGAAKEEGEEEKGRTKRGRGQGAIAKSKIEGVLLPSGFLDNPKSNEEITSELSRKGWPVPGKRVSDALIQLVKAAKLDRFGNPGSYKYARTTKTGKN